MNRNRACSFALIGFFHKQAPSLFRSATLDSGPRGSCPGQPLAEALALARYISPSACITLSA